MSIWFMIAGAVAVLGFVVIYNSLVGRKNDVETCWGAIDAYFQKRSDLIPNLVSAVKTYMTHEKDLLEKIVQLRERASRSPHTPEESSNWDGQTSQLLKTIMVRAEAYPELKANQNFLHLQSSLNEVEEQLSAARRAYNSSVTSYNNGVEMIPYNIVAGIMGYKRKAVLTVSEAQKEVPNLDRLFGDRAG